MKKFAAIAIALGLMTSAVSFAQDTTKKTTKTKKTKKAKKTEAKM